MTFQEFIGSLKLQHFEADEILIGTSREGNTTPPRHLWPNIAPTLLVLDQVRERLGFQIVITSCYRSPEYNRRIGGAKWSQHQAFRAVDFVVSRTSPAAVQSLLRHWRGAVFQSPVRVEHVKVDGIESVPLDYACREFVFHGGVGSYETFTHLDTRGIDADWSG